MVTHQKVGSVLRRAGFTRTRPLKAGIIGLYDYTEGYKIRAHPDGSVRVEHELPVTGIRRPNADQRRQQALAKYAEALTAAGVTCETRDESVICP